MRYLFIVLIMIGIAMLYKNFIIGVAILAITALIFIESMYNSRKSNEEGNQNTDNNVSSGQETSNYSMDIFNINNIRCPNCGSTYVRKISFIDRIFSINHGSGNTGNTYKCENCGYKW